ncbi:class F sortase [Cellulomonas sp. C5510]|uniref:class F sortase n=1 Tax=Cellulomonas sp. C5510 TaxID=2871170 RepID=UPI001C965D5F|nr:class F sortase [Cellulomonas sp. C5510]QZN85433.1 class F sortase [Cellulomonas sp. C5510]
MAGLVAAVLALLTAGLAVAAAWGAAPPATRPDPAVTSPAPEATPTPPAADGRAGDRPGTSAAGAVPLVAATPPPVAAASPTAPVRVVVPAQQIDVPVDPVGVAADGRMEIPPLAERGGWYRFGADPGDDAGTTVVAAHVDSVASGGTGPFVRLVEVRPGDRVEVTLADGSTRAYAVDAVTRFPKTEARWPDVFTREGPARLALVTCGGSFDRDARSYTDNVLVVATPVGA